MTQALYPGNWLLFLTSWAREWSECGGAAVNLEDAVR